jgi:hypothetical protein
MNDASKAEMQTMRDRIASLERRAKIMPAAITITVAVLLFAGWQQTHDTDVITAKELVVVDDHGTKRLMLGAPLPGPIMGSKPQTRRSAFNGLVLNDAGSNEVGGIGVMDDGTEVICFDQNGRERACLCVLPDGKASLVLKDGKQGDRIRLNVEADGKSTRVGGFYALTSDPIFSPLRTFRMFPR